MKFKINKVCDLNSISVLPPPSRSDPSSAPSVSARPPPSSYYRRIPSGVGSRMDASGAGGTQQHWSQSQQSSQGMPMSQLSQGSLEDNQIFDQQFGSQENNPLKNASLAPMGSAREDSQLQLSRASNNVMRRWKPPSDPDARYSSVGQLNEELKGSFQLIEATLSRLCKILDSVQGDVMQVTRAIKEVAMETECIRKKIAPINSQMQQMLTMEENIKTSLDGWFRTIQDSMIKESSAAKLNEIMSALSSIPEQVEARLSIVERQACRVSMNDVLSRANQTTKQPQGRRLSGQCSNVPRMGRLKRDHVLKVEVEHTQPLKPKLTGSKPHVSFKQEVLPTKEQVRDFVINIDSNEESDRDSSCVLLKSITGEGSWSMEDAREESLRILRRARKRKRRQSLGVIHV